ncbi:MAG: adenylyltransferase/cytidyltransferase family protein [Candidatus Burarchaeum sp.]|nr:adenylyltransferase/cytidyltransferase family protein [Candidatus Burarchaeum sp.]MDO8339255.1 adenylyltransferase/cytidyltransferase family protein [Candidatus Burarchaeum sp.]
MKIKALLVQARLEEIRKGKFWGQKWHRKEKEAIIGLGYARRKGTGFELTEKGRKKVKIVMTGGVFDILHLGHVYTLERARRMGDALVVVVAHDSTVRRTKGRPPVHSARHRAELLGKLRCVDLALIGDAKDWQAVVRRVRPDVIVFGYDQKADDRLRARVRKIRGRMNEKVFKTSRIVEEL